MADAGGEVMSGLCGGCCLCIFSGLTAFWGTQSYASGSSRKPGCCRSCCRSSFDEDAFDAEVKKDMARTRDPNAQPAPTAGMSSVPPQAEGATNPSGAARAVSPPLVTV